MTDPITCRALSDRLVDDVVGHLEALLERHLPDWTVPRVFAGHPVGADVTADLAFTLGLVHDAGVERIAGTPVPEAISRVLRPIDGPGTHSFFSYRVAEALERFGRFDGNPLLSGWTADEIDNIGVACDSTSFVKLLDDGHLPRNYAAVLARCEAARLRLGLDVDESLVDRLVDQTRAMLADNPRGFLDDSQTHVGRYDIYTADVYLFTHTLSEQLGDTWQRGARAAIDLVARVAATDGSAITWGRSTGALAACLTIELGALALEQDLTDDPEGWLARADHAAQRFGGWMSGGVINAHQHRSTYDYRGPQRRLQMTLDCLGKLAESALTLQRADEPQLAASTLESAFPDRDELVVLDPDRNAAVWTYRSPDLAFVLPLVGGTISDYLPTPHNPGAFEVPVDSALVTGVPAVWAGFGHYAAGGLPSSIEKRDRGLVAEYAGLPVANEMERGSGSDPLPCERRVEYRVEGRTIRVEEQLRFEREPRAVSIQVAESDSRRLDTSFSADRPHRVTTIDTSGLKEYRSFWSELPRVHQIDVEPAMSVTIAWSVTPQIRVGTADLDHHYMRAIYEPIADRIDVSSFPTGLIARGAAVTPHLDAIDVFHQHWPEWLTMQDLSVHQEFIDRIERSDVRLAWTQHNLEPHVKVDLAGVYQAWAAAAHGVVHHSEWGMQQSVERYEFRPDALHRVIPHVHWGPDIATDHVDRAAVEEELALRPCAIRLGVIGAPRSEKNVQQVLDAVHRCRRDDIGLLVTSVADERVPDDPRIRALPYEFTSRRRYNEFLAAMDVVILPFASRGMLTTGVIGDVVGAGLPAIVSPWAYLAEALGDAGIPYDGTQAGLVELLDTVDEQDLARAAQAAAGLQPRYDRDVIADAHRQLFADLGVGLTRR